MNWWQIILVSLAGTFCLLMAISVYFGAKTRHYREMSEIMRNNPVPPQSWPNRENL